MIDEKAALTQLYWKKDLKKVLGFEQDSNP